VCFTSSGKHELKAVNLWKSLLSYISFQDVNHALRVTSALCIYISLKGVKVFGRTFGVEIFFLTHF
jgi:hypothetical protein